MKTAIGIDLGGTNVKGILLNENGEILQKHYIPTQDSKDGNWKLNVLEMVNFLKNSNLTPIEIIGLSAPGFANETNSCIAHLPSRLPGIENFVWADYFKTQTFVINDAHAALMAEAKFGAIKNYKNAILITLGTGVGGGILLNGELYQGFGQMAGHFGHTTINSNDDERSILGIPGSLEYALGNYSIERRSMGRFKSTLALIQSYKENDPFAQWLWLDSVRNLSVSMASIINVFSPEIIVLSGGITLAGDLLFNPLNTFMDIFEYRPNAKKTIIKKAEFDDLSGAIGAAAFALRKAEK